MQNNDMKAEPNYECEYHRACEQNEHLKIEIHSLEEQYKGLENTLADAEKEIAFLKGQVSAFQFCVKHFDRRGNNG